MCSLKHVAVFKVQFKKVKAYVTYRDIFKHNLAAFTGVSKLGLTTGRIPHTVRHSLEFVPP